MFIVYKEFFYITVNVRDDAPDKSKNSLMIRDKIRQVLSLSFLRLVLSNPPETTMLSGPMIIVCFIPFITVYAMKL